MSDRYDLTPAQAPTSTTVGRRAGAAVRFEGIAKYYGRTTALQPTSFAIEPGEFFAIIGPSGSGKSTLLGITAGFVAPSDGEVFINGRGIVTVPPYHRDIGMVFQNYALFPHMSVAENVAFPLRMRRLPRAKIKEKVARVLAMVRLEAFDDRRPSELSGGQQQRVALARAAVYDPLLLLMDEPLGALDKNLREEMQEEIKRFQAALGATVIYVTHDQQEAAYMADRLAIMRGGAIEQTGSPRELYERPETLFVAGFLGEAAIFPVAEVVEHLGDQATVRTDDGIVVHATMPSSVGSGRAVVLRPENVMIGEDAYGLVNHFHGVVEERVYTTGTIRYRVRLDPYPTVVTVRVPSRLGIELLDPEARIDVGWTSEDALVVIE